MIIDLILDRRDSEEYNPRDFYKSVYEYFEIWPEICAPIIKAMDNGNEEDVRRELCNYIDRQGYNPEIKDYVNSVKWIYPGPKLYSFSFNLGRRAKYCINYHNGQAMNPDGSNFWGIRIFSNKKEFDKAVRLFQLRGYRHRFSI